jgi:hypothetical protein
MKLSTFYFLSRTCVKEGVCVCIGRACGRTPRARLALPPIPHPPTPIQPPTWHVHGAVLLHGVPDAQLPIGVPAPALDPAIRHDCARMATPQGNGGGGDACGRGEGGRWGGVKGTRGRECGAGVGCGADAPAVSLSLLVALPACAPPACTTRQPENTNRNHRQRTKPARATHACAPRRQCQARPPRASRAAASILASPEARTAPALRLEPLQTRHQP